MPTVLIVDDDLDIRDLLRFRLTRAGFEVHAEADGESGLAAALALRPDVAVLDWMMPGLTGLEVCRRLREDPATAATPVVLLTAKAQSQDLEKAFAAGVDDYIRKPFGGRELLDCVEALLARSG